MGSVLSSVLGTNSSIPVAQQTPLSLGDYSQAISHGAGILNQAGAGEMGLASALMAQQNGGGPNPAASMLTQAQGQNAAQAAGVYANNRAINPALAARQAASQQANTNQQAGNQAATLRAQQQLSAQNQLGGLYGQIGQQGLGLSGQALSGQIAQNQAINSSNAINAGVASGNQSSSNGIVGGLLGGIGSVAGHFLGLAHGGQVQGYDAGGYTLPDLGSNSLTLPELGSSAGIGMPAPAPSLGLADAVSQKKSGPSALAGIGSGLSSSAQNMGPNDIARFLALAHSKGGQINMLSGGDVPGKAKVSGDSTKNDTVPAMLSPGEVVIPRSSASDPEKAKEFVDHIMKDKGKAFGYGGMMAKHRELSSRISALEKRLGKKAS